MQWEVDDGHKRLDTTVHGKEFLSVDERWLQTNIIHTVRFLRKMLVGQARGNIHVDLFELRKRRYGANEEVESEVVIVHRNESERYFKVLSLFQRYYV